ncbi:hypothetical protein E2320_022415 [Naja naja]|nr:hypothetical protein E2320_022415 [Naja naja]
MEGLSRPRLKGERLGKERSDLDDRAVPETRGTPLPIIPIPQGCSCWVRGARGLLSVGGISPLSSSTVAAVSILPPLYLLVGPWLGDPPLLVSSAAWSWWLAIYGAVGFSWLLWGILAEGQSTKESQKEEDKATLWKMLRLFGPDKLYLSGETFLPYYTGRVIDILGTKYDAEAFSTAIFLLCLMSFGSSAFASCHGGLFMFIISRMVIRTNLLLFSGAARPGLLPGGENSSLLTGALASRLSKDTTMMSNSVPLNTNVFLRTLIKTLGLYGFMIGLSWRLTLLMLIETPLMMVVQKVYNARRQVIQLSMKLILLYCGYQQIRTGLMTGGNLVSSILYQTNVGRMSPLSSALGSDGWWARTAAERAAAWPSWSTSTNPNPGKSCWTESQLGNTSTSISIGSHRPGIHPGANKVALVGQEPVLFSGSIRENITYGLQGCSEEDVSRAAGEADALGFIRELEGGFDAEVGEKGGQLSIGQKQRLAIARALIRDPKVLVLDEAMSALDPESDTAIQRSVQKHGARTVLVIAHRMQTVENADKIVVLEGGEVVEEGTHAELMGWQGPYYRLVERTQAGDFGVATEMLSHRISCFCRCQMHDWLGKETTALS